MRPTEIKKAERIVCEYDAILKLFSDICNVSGYLETELKSASRDRDLAYTRAAYAYIAYNTYATILHKHIGEILNKDRSSVFAMIRSVKEVKEKMIYTNYLKDELHKM